jgi:hypothetical protein
MYWITDWKFFETKILHSGKIGLKKMEFVLPILPLEEVVFG